jgi:hypothetical protein
MTSRHGFSWFTHGRKARRTGVHSFWQSVPIVRAVATEDKNGQPLFDFIRLSAHSSWTDPALEYAPKIEQHDS